MVRRFLFPFLSAFTDLFFSFAFLWASFFFLI